MVDVLTLAVQLAPTVLKEIVFPILKEKAKHLASTQDNTTPTLQIKDPEIIEKIKKTLQKQDDIQSDIQNNHETMKQLIQEVLNVIKLTSEKTPDLKVEGDEIQLPELIQQKDQEFDLQKLEARLEKIQKSLEENIARYQEIQTSSSQSNNIPHLMCALSKKMDTSKAHY